ncbi:MAG TPA: RimK family alpha-L-glutamate ligase [Candidatus Nanoarchaeia archaeon]|nr:RimK family alpha-L-glutamate ligase [Candidatus Nanoarchaeia archaeon]
MKFGIISLEGDSSRNVLAEAGKLFDRADSFDIRKLELHASNDGLQVLYQGKHLEKYDCVYIRGSYKYALLQRAITRALSHDTYLPLAPKAFTLGHDKLLTLLELQRNGVHIPKTYFAATTALAKQILKEVQYPIIMKIPSGTQGKGVMMADSANAAQSMLDALEVFKQPYIIQEFVDTDATDLRVIVAGDEVIAAMKRVGSKEDFRANIHLGAKGEKHNVDSDVERAAVKAARAIGAEICAVDLLEGNKTSVIEVNLSPGLKGIAAATGENIAAKVAKFLHSRTLQFKKEIGGTGFKEMMKNIGVSESKKDVQEIIGPLNVKAGIIKLPKVVTDISKFHTDEDVLILASKGKVEIKKYNIKKEEKE